LATYHRVSLIFGRAPK